MVDIYVPTKELIVPHRLRVGTAAYISWAVCKKGSGKVVREAGPYKNLITDSGLDRWGGTDMLTIGQMVANCYVGSGSSAPAPGNTSLDSFIAQDDGRTQLDTDVQTNTLPYYGWTRWEYQFDAGAAQGNLSELGFGPTSTSLFSRQLFRDGLGDPTTITVLSDEFLRVTYEVRKYLPNPLDFVQDPVTISGNDYEVTTRPLNALENGENFWSNDLEPPIEDNDMGAESGGLLAFDTQKTMNEDTDSCTMGSYTAGSFTRTVQGVWNPGTSTGTIGRVEWSPFAINQRGGWQTAFSPALNKTADDRMILQFYVEWGRQGEL